MSDDRPAEFREPEEPPSAAVAGSMIASDSVPASESAEVLESTAVAETQLQNVAERSVSDKKVPTSYLWLTKHDHSFVTICVAIFLALTGYHWAKLGGWGMEPIDVDRLPARQHDFRIDVNSATWVEWTQIEGIGQATANKIIADREAHGPFNSVNDLLRVKSIGPKTLEKMRPYLREPGSDTDR